MKNEDEKECRAMKDPLRPIMATAAGVLSLLFLAGCLSTNPGSSSLAYVDVDTADMGAIRTETVRVFDDDNYLPAGETAGALVFEREATQRDRVLFGRYGDDKLTMRVVVSLEPRRKGGYLLRSDAYVVRDGDEEKVPWMARRPYQNLLNQVKASLVKAEGDR
jgi:hypothetical protein